MKDTKINLTDLPTVTDCPVRRAPPQLPGSTRAVTDGLSCPVSSAPTPRIYPGGHGRPVLSGKLRPSSLDLPVVTDGLSCPASSAPTPWIYRWSQTTRPVRRAPPQLPNLPGWSQTTRPVRRAPPQLPDLPGWSQTARPVWRAPPQLPGSTGGHRRSVLSGELRPNSQDLPVVTDDPSCPASSAPTPRIYPGGHGRPSCDWTGREKEWVGGEVMGPPPPARRPRPAQLGRYFRDQLTRSDVRGASIAIIADSGGALARFRRRGSLGRQSAAQRPAELAAVDVHRRDGVVAPASVADPTIDTNMCRTQ